MNETICSMLNLCLPFAQKNDVYYIPHSSQTTLKLKASLTLCLLYLLFSLCRAFEATHLVQDREAWREGVPVRGLRHRAGPGEL